MDVRDLMYFYRFFLKKKICTGETLIESQRLCHIRCPEKEVPIWLFLFLILSASELLFPLISICFLQLGRKLTYSMSEGPMRNTISRCSESTEKTSTSIKTHYPSIYDIG